MIKSLSLVLILGQDRRRFIGEGYCSETLFGPKGDSRKVDGSCHTTHDFTCVWVDLISDDTRFPKG